MFAWDMFKGHVQVTGASDMFMWHVQLTGSCGMFSALRCFEPLRGTKSLLAAAGPCLALAAKSAVGSCRPFPSPCYKECRWQLQADFVYSTSSDTCICVWSPEADKQSCLARVEAHQSFVAGVVPLQRASQLMWSFGNDKQLRLWNVSCREFGLQPTCSAVQKRLYDAEAKKDQSEELQRLLAIIDDLKAELERERKNHAKHQLFELLPSLGLTFEQDLQGALVAAGIDDGDDGDSVAGIHDRDTITKVNGVPVQSQGDTGQQLLGEAFSAGTAFLDMIPITAGDTVPITLLDKTTGAERDVSIRTGAIGMDSFQVQRLRRAAGIPHAQRVWRRPEEWSRVGECFLHGSQRGRITELSRQVLELSDLLADKESALADSRQRIEQLQQDHDIRTCIQIKRAQHAETALAECQALSAKQLANDRELDLACQALLSDAPESESKRGCAVPFRVDGMESTAQFLGAMGTADSVDGQAELRLAFTDGGTAYGKSDGQTLKWDDGSMWKRDPHKLFGFWCDAAGEKRELEPGTESKYMKMRDNAARPIAEVTVSEDDSTAQQLEIVFVDGSMGGHAKALPDGQTLEWDDGRVWQRAGTVADVLGAWIDDAGNQKLLRPNVNPDTVEIQHTAHSADIGRLKELLERMATESQHQKDKIRELEEQLADAQHMAEHSLHQLFELRPWLGVEVEHNETSAGGPQVMKVLDEGAAPGGTAAAAFEVGDRICAVQGVPILSEQDLEEVMA